MFANFANSIRTKIKEAIIAHSFMRIAIWVAAFFMATVSVAAAQEVEPAGIAESVKSFSLKLALIGAIIIAITTLLALITNGKTEKFKKILFTLYVIAAAVPTLYFTASTIYLNAISDSRGPVHWHMDFEIYVCDEPVKLAGPTGFLSNRVGTPDFHHHDDMRLHVEGVMVNFADFELEDFFAVSGGELTNDLFTIPADDGTITVKNGDTCPDGTRGEWQVFLYEMTDLENDLAHQVPLDQNYPHYIVNPYSSIPPGDCIIFEFGQRKVETEHICQFWELARDKGDITIE